MATILVIDEYDGFRETMAFCLPRFGHQVRCAENVAGGLALAADEPVQLVLLDAALAGGAGGAATEIRRVQAGTAAPVVLLVGGRAEAAVVRAALAAGAVGVVPKPFRWSELLAVIAQWAENE